MYGMCLVSYWSPKVCTEVVDHGMAAETVAQALTADGELSVVYSWELL